MSLRIVNTFSSVYESWSTRDATQQENIEHYEREGSFLPFVNDKLIAVISDHFSAAEYMAEIGADNGLENHIDKFLDQDSNYKSWRSHMPSRTPRSITKFQQSYPNYIQSDVDTEINMIGKTLSEGQFLFHGGCWFNSRNNKVVLNKPFSTSFCPQVALRNAEWGGKAYDESRIDLFVLRVTNPKTNVFAYKRKGTRMGNEKEVLFATGAEVRLRSRTLIRDDYVVGKYGYSSKKVPIYVIEVDIS
ncbi:hypothetical protein [Aliivibrio logei]|uniref:ADP ribosyltransferase domain-containing protein n=1 Tax=Aliivibrio logei TaxID=688 RepID=A0A1B9NW15_ALILO|nr:hypothetical protein [Aliivibrio logei]OCH19089.1 hypothetical protein A6E04_16895 [Aliivibrio logei]